MGTDYGIEFTTTLPDVQAREVLEFLELEKQVVSGCRGYSNNLANALGAIEEALREALENREARLMAYRRAREEASRCRKSTKAQSKKSRPT